MTQRITQSRRRFVEILGEKPKITFSEFKKELVDSGEMNLATLYRIIEAFKQSGLIHELDIDGERIIFPCQHMDHTDNVGITISYCENCGTIYDEHTKLMSPYTSSTTYNRMKSCNACIIR